LFYLRYIEAMFEVLVFVYENYWRGDACPEPDHLQRKLNAVGFEADEIQDALAWLSGLNLAAQHTQRPDELPVPPDEASLADWPTGTPMVISRPSSTSMRVYSAAEQDHLGAECLGFVTFLETAGVLPAHMREVVMDRAMAVTDAPMAIDDLKIIILMVYWSFGEEPDALVLDELCDDTTDRVAH
jgi:Smg protein